MLNLAKDTLIQKEPPELYTLVQSALEQAGLRDLLVDGCFARDETYRYNCVRVFFRALKKRSDLFYPYWQRFAEQITSPNGFYRSSATQAIAFLATVDKDRHLDSILDSYLQILDDKKIMVARYFTQTIHLIAQARPDLRGNIIAHLLEIDNTHHMENHKSLLKADIISAFDKLFDTLSTKEQEKTLIFAENELDSKSPTTRKAAKAFLKQHQIPGDH